MKILVIGGTKFIGREIVTKSIEAGHEVITFNRGKSSINQTDFIKGNVEEITKYKSELLALKPDIVVHCIAYTEKHAKDCVEIFSNTDTRIIVLSSMDCYEAFQKLNRGIEYSDFPIDENMELSSTKYYWKDILKNKPGGEEYDKNLMTRVFMKAHKKGEILPTVFRLPMVYGPHDNQYSYRHGSIIRRIYDRRKKYIMDYSTQNRIWTFGYVGNIAHAIIHSYSKEQTIGKIYNIGEKKVRSWRRWVNLFAKIAGWEFDYYILPDEILQSSSDIINPIPKHLIFDCSLYRHETGFEEPIKLTKCIEKTLKWAFENPEVLGDKPDYTYEESMAQIYYEFIRNY